MLGSVAVRTTNTATYPLPRWVRWLWRVLTWTQYYQHGVNLPKEVYKRTAATRLWCNQYTLREKAHFTMADCDNVLWHSDRNARRTDIGPTKPNNAMVLYVTVVHVRILSARSHAPEQSWVWNRWELCIRFACFRNKIAPGDWLNADKDCDLLSIPSSLRAELG